MSVNEKSVKAAIVAKLASSVSGYVVRDFPININDYRPKSPVGELLVKSQGKSTIRYIDRNNEIDVVQFGSFVIREYKWRIDLIDKKILSQDDLFDLTELVIETMENEVLIELPAGNFICITVGEPLYDPDKHFQYRILNFALHVLEQIGGDD